MVWNMTQTFPPNSTGAQSIGMVFPTVPFTDVLSGTPLYYHGSQIIVEETATINSVIVRPELVRVEDRWFDPKLYLGTWQRSSSISDATHNNNDYGLIRSYAHKLTRYTPYTLIANPAKLRTQSNGGSLDNCSFATAQVDATINIPPFTVNLGGQTPVTNTDLFTLRQWRYPASLAPAVYNVLLGSLGLYMYPGVEVISIDHTARVVNGIQVDDPAWVDSTCVSFTAPQETCQQQFDNAILASNAGSPIDTPNKFKFSTAALAGQYGQPFQEFWTCPETGEVFSYWSYGG